jgi:hypothetical protein
MASVCSPFCEAHANTQALGAYSYVVMQGPAQPKFFRVHLLGFVLWRISELGSTSEGGQLISFEVDTSPTVVNALLRELICRIIKGSKILFRNYLPKKYIRGRKK